MTTCALCSAASVYICNESSAFLTCGHLTEFECKPEAMLLQVWPAFTKRMVCCCPAATEPLGGDPLISSWLAILQLTMMVDQMMHFVCTQAILGCGWHLC